VSLMYSYKIFNNSLMKFHNNDLPVAGHYWQTRVLSSLKSREYSDVCGGASRHQPDILLKLLKERGENSENSHFLHAAFKNLSILLRNC
jgi:hypothetical protein